jgi:hypothetical protein
MTPKEFVSEDSLSPVNSRTPDSASVYRPRSRSATDTNTRRTMTSPACDQCYRFKVKCTREPECCQRCANNRSVCTYSAAAEKPEKRASPVKESFKKKVRYSPRVEERTPSNEFGMPNVNRQEFPFTPSPASQPEEIHAEEVPTLFGEILQLF